MILFYVTELIAKTILKQKEKKDFKEELTIYKKIITASNIA